MDFSQNATSFKDQIASISQIVVFLPDNASRDMVAAALSLYLSLIQQGKQVIVVYPRQPIVGWSHLVGVNKLTQVMSNKNFIISLDYAEGSIEKVSYNIEGNKFNLVIEPKTGSDPFDESKVSYSHAGVSADMLVTMGVQSLEQLGKYLTENKNLFSEKPIVAFDHKGAVNFGTVQLSKSASSISEVLAQVLQQIQIPINTDIASNLYDGLVSGSRNFTVPQVTGQTFELAAWLMRQGARKSNVVRQEEMPDKESSAPKSAEAGQTPPDWLKPKIYKSSNLL